MSEELDKKQEELKKIEQDLKHNGLSRRNFLNRLSAAGVGFGAALALGVKGADAAQTDAGVNVSSTNTAVDTILAEGQEVAADEGDPLQHMAQYGRRYGRVFRRGYPRIYGRGFRRGYPRIYGRGYGRGYGRRYRRFFARF